MDQIQAHGSVDEGQNKTFAAWGNVPNSAPSL